MSKTDELISKLEELIELLKFSHGERQNFEYYKDYHKLKSEISELKEQIKKEEKISSLVNNNYVAMDKVNEICDKAESDIELENKLIDFANWYLRLIKVTTEKNERFDIENRDIIWSFLRGDDYKLWWNAVNPEQTPDLDCGIYEEKQSGMREFVISEIKKGIIHPNPLTPSEMRVLNLCCKYLETHPVKDSISKSEKDEGMKSILIDLENGVIDKYAAYDLINVLYAHPVKDITDEEIEKEITHLVFEQYGIGVKGFYIEQRIIGAKWMRKRMSHEAI